MNRNLYLGAILLAAILGVLASMYLSKPQPIQLQAVTWLGPQGKTLPAFELVDHDRQPFDNQRLQGKWHLLFFGFTHCPDICPDTLQMLDNMFEALDDPAIRRQLQVVFVSVDPDRDDLATMKSYVTYFNSDFLSARAEIERLNVLTDAVGILHHTDRRGDELDYDVGHSASLILTNPEGRYIGVISTPHDSLRIAQDLKALIGHG